MAGSRELGTSCSSLAFWFFFFSFFFDVRARNLQVTSDDKVSGRRGPSRGTWVPNFFDLFHAQRTEKMTHLSACAQSMSRKPTFKVGHFDLVSIARLEHIELRSIS